MYFLWIFIKNFWSCYKQIIISNHEVPVPYPPSFPSPLLPLILLLADDTKNDQKSENKYKSLPKSGAGARNLPVGVTPVYIKKYTNISRLTLSVFNIGSN